MTLLTILAAATALAANDAPHCESTRPQFGDGMEVQCALRESDTPRKFRFEIRFTGGHDDTKASLSATLNGKPLTCDEGSKTKLFAEEGEVGIDCYFSSERIKGAQELKVSVEWHHAQYSEHKLHVL
jgi:hypothetical protein